MTQKPVKTVRKTVIAVFDDPKKNKAPVHVASRALEWEDAARSGNRCVHRVEYAGPGVDSGGYTYLIDLELTCRGANRHDFSKFVRSYLPEAELYYITD